MGVWVSAFFQVLFEELDKLFKPKPTPQQLEIQRRLNIQKNFWRVIIPLIRTTPTGYISKPSKYCKMCQIMYRGCPINDYITYQRRKLPYSVHYCPAHIRQITEKYK